MKFLKLYAPIRALEDLSISEKVILSLVVSNSENPYSKLNQKEMASFTGLSYRYVKRALRELTKKGYCRYIVQGSEKFVSITGKVTSTIQGRGSRVPLGKYSSPREAEFPRQGKPSSPDRGSRVPPVGEAEFTPPLYIPSIRGIEESSRGGAEAPASAQKGRAGLRSEKEDGKGTDTESMRKNHSPAEADPRGEFRHAKKGCFERLKSTYHQHYPMGLKEEQDCWELFSDEVDSWEDYDKCRKGFLLRDAKPATLMDYLKEAPWRN